MAKPLGVTLIGMYEDMVKEDFAPLITRLKARTSMVEGEVDRQVKVDMGVYKLYEEKAALDMRIKELTRGIVEIEQKVYDKASGEYLSPIKLEVSRRLALANGPLVEAEKARDKLVRSIRLAGVGGDVKAVFDELPVLLEEMQKEYGSLDPLTADEFYELTTDGATARELPNEDTVD